MLITWLPVRPNLHTYIAIRMSEQRPKPLKVRERIPWFCQKDVRKIKEERAIHYRLVSLCVIVWEKSDLETKEYGEMAWYPANERLRQGAFFFFFFWREKAHFQGRQRNVYEQLVRVYYFFPKFQNWEKTTPYLFSISATANKVNKNKTKVPDKHIIRSFRLFALLWNSESNLICKLIQNRFTGNLRIKTTAAFVYAKEQLSPWLLVLVCYSSILDIQPRKVYWNNSFASGSMNIVEYLLRVLLGKYSQYSPIFEN